MFKRTAAVAATACIGAVFNAPSAAADEYDYLDNLDNKGVPYTSMSDGIDIGKQACANLRRGMPVPVTEAVVQTSGYSFIESRIIIGAAVTNMCPDAKPIIDIYMRGPASAPPG